MNSPLVSIAMCTYNGIQFIREQLDSLINQTYFSLEIIIVDDGSTDGTIELIQEYGAKDSRIKFYRNEVNLGLVRNFEKAIDLCSGEYIALCDQDDIWMLDKIDIMVRQFDHCLLIYHDSQLTDENGNNLVKVSDLFNMYQGDNPLALIFYNSISGHACMFSKRLVPLLKLNGPFDPQFYHDWWIAFVALNYGCIKYIDQALVKYRQHVHSNTDLRNIKEQSRKRITPKYEEVKLPWLRKCYTVNGRYKNYIGRLVSCFTHKTWLNSFELWYLLTSQYQYTYFMKKKPVLSKINYLRKLSFHKREF